MIDMRSWHSKFGGREWRVAPDGIHSRGDGGLELHRTRGAPRTMRLYLALWGEELMAAARAEEVPLALLLMTLATENGPAQVDDNRLTYIPWRKEPGYVSDQETPHRISIGPTHVLISTARTAMGDPSIGRAWLQDVGNNLRACARCIRDKRGVTRFDPILVAAAYNAGGLYEALPGRSTWGNRWHLRTYGAHLDRAAAWYGDAARVLGSADELAGLDARGLGRVFTSHVAACDMTPRG